MELRDLGISLDSPEAKRLFLQKLEGAKTEINLGEKTDALFKTKFYENTLLKNTNDLNEKDSSTAATPPVIGGQNDVSTGDVIRIDVDAVATNTLGLEVRMVFST